MSSPIVSLAIVDGFWGQVFEYWPFSLLVTVTIIYTALAFGSDLISRRKWKPPAGAVPRIEVKVDPTFIARAQFSSGLFWQRFGTAVTVVAGVVIVFIAYHPLAIGENYGLTQATDDAFIAGTWVSLVAAIVALLASIAVRRYPVPLMLLVLAAGAVIVLGPFLTTGDGSRLAKMAALMALPQLMVVLGTVKALRYHSRARRPTPAHEPAAQQASTP